MTTKTYTETELMEFVKRAFRFGFHSGFEHALPDIYRDTNGLGLEPAQEFYLNWVQSNLAVANTVKES